MRYNELIESEDDDLFGAGQLNWHEAVTEAIGRTFRQAKHYLEISDPVGDVGTRTDMRIAMKDCKAMAQALKAGGIPAFLDSLNDVSRNTVDSIDAYMAEHGVYLHELEQAFIDKQDFNEDDDMFGEIPFRVKQAGALIAYGARMDSGQIIAPESVEEGLRNAAVLPKYRAQAQAQLKKWLALSEDEQWHLLDDVANAVYNLVGDGWKPEETIYDRTDESDDDDELFGRAQHQRIADALMAAAEEDQRISDEERGLGDLDNAAEFAEQARNYRYIASAFGESMAQGIKVYRSLDGGWRQAVEDVVDMDMEDQDMNFRSYAKTLPEHVEDDDDMFGKPDEAVQVYRLMHRLRDAVRRNPQGLKQALAQYPDAQRNLREKIAFDFMADELGMNRAVFDELVPEMHMLPFRFSEPDWFSDYWNTRRLNSMIKRLGAMLKDWNLQESDDDDMFGSGQKHAVLNIISQYESQVKDKYQAFGDDHMQDILEEIQEVKTAISRDFVRGLDMLLELSQDEVWADSVWQWIQADLELDYQPPWLREDAEDDELFGETTIADRVEGLLKHKQKVRIMVPGAMGYVRRISPGATVISRNLRSTTMYSWPGLHGTRAQDFELIKNTSSGTWDVIEREQADNYFRLNTR